MKFGIWVIREKEPKRELKPGIIVTSILNTQIYKYNKFIKKIYIINNIYKRNYFNSRWNINIISIFNLYLNR